MRDVAPKISTMETFATFLATFLAIISIRVSNLEAISLTIHFLTRKVFNESTTGVFIF